MFSHLHVHSEYSVLDGACKVEELLLTAKDYNQPAICITDHGSTSSWWQAQQLGEKIGIKQSSAQITECYKTEELIGKQVLGVVNFPAKQIASFRSEVLILGVYAEQGVVLIQPEQPVKKGDRLG